MRMLTFSGRVTKEILRDPLNLCFGIGFPLILLYLLSAIQANIPVPLFTIENLAPGVTVFGLSFMTLFSSLLVARDRESAFLPRLYTTPLRAADFIFGYILPLLPIALCQSTLCLLASIPLGLSPSPGIPLAILLNLPVSLFYISLGLLFGSFLNTKQVGGICGAGLTNVSAWLSGIWFDVALVGGVFEKAADLLPFIHAVELSRAAYMCDFPAMLAHLPWVLGYTVAVTALAVLLFLRQMKKQ